MKKYIFLSITIIISAPFIVFGAAYNDVSLTTTTISVGGTPLNITASSATIEQLTVNSSNFVLKLLPGSIASVSSPNRYNLAHDAASTYVSSSSCNTSESSAVFNYPAGDGSAVNITVTPSATPCYAVAGGVETSGGTSSGGGGGGATVTYVPPVVTPVITPVITPTPSISTPAPSVGAVSLTRALRVGMSGADILALQVFLNSDPDTRIADSGVGSLGNETDYFGALTRIAIQKFQAKYGIVTEGTPETTGYGAVGPKTRAKIAEVSGN